MERMTKGEGMTPEEYIAKLEEEVESRKEYQRRSQSVDGEHIENLLGEKYKLEEENKKLKEDNRFLTKISKEYMEKENIIEVTEFTELYKDELEEENKKLKERILELEKCNLNLQERLDRKEEVNKSYRKEIKKLKETIKDHQFYEEKLEHRIIEFEELLHGE